MGDMSEEQEKQLEVFRKYIKDNNITDHPQYDDYYLLRFLRARKFDMEKTLLMFNNFMNWRKEQDVDNILTVRYSRFFLTLLNDIELCLRGR
jgi:CRAL/TRIO, N-terminal domain